jgi:dihydrofolate synthase/folylpolyglutamate synthase
VTRAAIRAGLANARWPGRLERLSDPAGGAWLLDGAHNADAAAALVATWEPPAAIVAGFRADKEATAMVSLLTVGGRPLVVAPVPGIASWGAADLAAASAGPVFDAADLDQALAIARRLAPTGLRAVTGSLWLVGAARSRLAPATLASTDLPGAA